MTSAPHAVQANRQGRFASTWRLLSGEPHRLMFFFGALQALAAIGWWAADLGARYLGWYQPWPWSVPPMWAHGWLLVYGLYPFFMFGFLMTAGPNWLGAPRMRRGAYVPAGLLMAAGLGLVYAGLAANSVLAAAGMLVHALGWLWGLGALADMAARHWNANGRHAAALFGFFATGALASCAFAIAVLSGAYGYAPAALQAGIWLVLLPIFLAVSARMVPFFASRVLGEHANYRPAWVRPVLVGGAIAHGVLELSGAHAFLWVTDIPLALLIACLAWRWGLRQALRVRLLAVLHISLMVLAGALLLSGVLAVLLATGAIAAIGLAPLHLIAIGYFAAMALGMVSRVTLGHSGRPLEADTLTWMCYLGVLLAALLRAGAEFAAGTAAGVPLTMLSAFLWLAAFGMWAWRYVPMYLMPRVDARIT